MRLFRSATRGKALLLIDRHTRVIWYTIRMRYELILTMGSDRGTDSSRARPRATKLSDRICEAIRADIAAGALVMGDSLQEQAIASQYGGSRTPVREALQRLVREGLVTKLPKGYIVRVLSPFEVRAIYEVREPLERSAVSLAAERATSEQIKRLYALAEAQTEMLTKTDRNGFRQAHTSFHIAIAQATGNVLLNDYIMTLHDNFKLIRAQELTSVEHMEQVSAQCTRIVDAIARRQPKIAQEEMRIHIHSVKDKYIAKS